MKFTKEAWENAPEGARLEYLPGAGSYPVHFVGWTIRGDPVIQSKQLLVAEPKDLRIVLPKRKVTVQLWRAEDGRLATSTPETLKWVPCDWTLLGEHIFEIEGK